MKNIKVLGTGCANCKATLKLIDQVANAEGIEIELEKIEDMPQIMSYGILSTPGVVVDGKLVHSGGIPSKDSVKSWVSSNSDTGGCCSGSTEQTPSSGGCCA